MALICRRAERYRLVPILERIDVAVEAVQRVRAVDMSVTQIQACAPLARLLLDQRGQDGDALGAPLQAVGRLAIQPELHAEVHMTAAQIDSIRGNGGVIVHEFLSDRKRLTMLYLCFCPFPQATEQECQGVVALT